MRTMSRDFYRPRATAEDLVHTKLDVPNVEYYTWSRNGNLFGMAFGGKRAKPDFYFRFPSEEARARRIQEHTNREIYHAKETARRRAERNVPHQLKVGDVLYCSWGYDQTNIDFYEVTEIVGKQTVRIMPICGRTESSSPPCDYVVPVPGAVKDWDVLLRVESGDEDKTRVKRVKNGNCVTIGHGHTASPWGGKPLYETSSGWGH